MKSSTLLSMGLLSLLLGCRSTPYKKKNGDWYYDKYIMAPEDMKHFKPLNKRFGRSDTKGFYRGLEISGSDGKSFEGLNNSYAKDKNAVYYCDTYRKGQEYYMIKRNRVVTIEGADPATFVYLSDKGFARDKQHVFLNADMLDIKDPDSYKLLVGSYSRDDFFGYYNSTRIEGSNGKTFMVVDLYYAKDSLNVYFDGQILKGADTQTFQELPHSTDSVDAKDGKHNYKKGQIL